jgi:hypothetical protein
MLGRRPFVNCHLIDRTDNALDWAYTKAAWMSATAPPPTALSSLPLGSAVSSAQQGPNQERRMMRERFGGEAINLESLDRTTPCPGSQRTSSFRHGYQRALHIVRRRRSMERSKNTNATVPGPGPGQRARCPAHCIPPCALHLETLCNIQRGRVGPTPLLNCQMTWRLLSKEIMF